MKVSLKNKGKEQGNDRHKYVILERYMTRDDTLTILITVQLGTIIPQLLYLSFECLQAIQIENALQDSSAN